TLSHVKRLKIKIVYSYINCYVSYQYKLMNLQRLGVLLILLLIFKGENLSADDHSNARGKGMCNSNVVSSFGIGAFGVNPANFDNHLNPDFNINKLTLGKKSEKPVWEVS